MKLSIALPMFATMTSATTCSDHHNGMNEFRNAVAAGIQRATSNDAILISWDLDVVDRGAKRASEKYSQWFIRLFDRWMNFAKAAHNEGRRPCMTRQFPNFNPGNLDKECVSLN